MATNKKLQVFISSTYTDLLHERQAAVQAVLTAGHIPAGMELFAAGDQSQMAVIKRWIDESDVYLLILGGRYGSVEPASGKSYIHLEYDYATEVGKPLFSVVIREEHLKAKAKAAEDPLEILETDNAAQLKDFRDQVLSKMVRFWSDEKDIKLSILETLSHMSKREELHGWIPGNLGVDAGPLAEEIARLTKENASLQSRLSQASSQFGGLSYEEIYRLLASEKPPQLKEERSIPKGKHLEVLERTARAFGDESYALLHFFWLIQSDLTRPAKALGLNELNEWIFSTLSKFGLANMPKKNEVPITESGRLFLLKLALEKGDDAKRCLVEYEAL